MNKRELEATSTVCFDKEEKIEKGNVRGEKGRGDKIMKTILSITFLSI